MNVRNLLKYSLLLLIVLLFSAAIKYRLYDRSVVNYKIDLLYSHYIQIFNAKPFVPTSQKKPDQSKINAFVDLEPGYSYMGHILLYRLNQKNSARSIDEFCKSSFKYSRYLSLSDYKKAFVKINTISGVQLASEHTYYIPQILAPLIHNFSYRQKKPSRIKALYFTGRSTGSELMIKRLISSYKNAGINAVVFDVKDIEGHLSYYSQIDEVQTLDSHRYRTIDDIHKVIRLLKEHGIYVIARVACFRDLYAARARPEWSIQSSKGGMWNRDKGEIWLDPTNKFVQDYTIKIAEEIADLGADEIQFDYIRFPTGGDQSDALYNYDFGIMKREDVITLFLKNAYQKLKKKGVLVSIDIFGVVAWGFEGDIESTGQRISKLAPYCDIISPMLYPSHFNDNFRGIKRPGDAPYYFIAEGVTLVKEQAGTTLVRPWLQAFAWRVTDYNQSYIHEQIRASIEKGAEGYLFWNAKNSYDTVYKAMITIDKTYK